MRQPLPTEVQDRFADLSAQLSVRELPTSTGATRKAHVGEFMLMAIGDKGEAQFKHRNTRNYVFITPAGKLVVPQTQEAFMQGFFDAE